MLLSLGVGFLTCLSHWDSAFSHASPTGTRHSHMSLPLGLGVLPHASPTGTRHSHMPLPQGLGILTCPSHKDSAFLHAPPTGTRHSPTCLSHGDSACIQRYPLTSTLRHTRSDVHINVRPEPYGTYFTIFQLS
ncbi:hypothetical protein Adt_16869 [Abeliophyllum distichum]|uniref:Uncharacterized protein n=1 Tax=Abeliophyllum distichum TaxID=126358 RepID=A0ABD1TEZ5_9LAMI